MKRDPNVQERQSIKPKTSRRVVGPLATKRILPLLAREDDDQRRWGKEPKPGTSSLQVRAHQPHPHKNGKQHPQKKEAYQRAENTLAVNVQNWGHGLSPRK